MRLAHSVGLMDDRAALRRYARTGDPEAFAVLAGRYRDMVFATCMRSLGNESDAEDAAQETFVRFAQQAGQIRSNAAAWLHACAMGVSVDAVRRAGARRRAERAAVSERVSETVEAQTGEAGAGGDAMARWRLLEPEIDRALAALDKADREMIVGRYLAGRSQAEIARERGVSEGTVSRRLKRALQRLRAELGAMGVETGTVTGLSAALALGAGVAASEALAASIGKVGLSGLAQAGGGAGQSIPVLAGTGVAAGLVVLGLVSATVLQGSGRGAGSAPARAVAGAAVGVSGAGQGIAVARGPARPTKAIGPFQVVTATDERFEERGLWIGDGGISIRMGFYQGEANQTNLRIRSIAPMEDDPATPDLEERAVIETSVRQILPRDSEWARFHEAGIVSIVASFDQFGRIVLEDRVGNVQIGRNEPRWYGVRPPIGWPEFGRIPDDAGTHGILGPWTEAERIPVTITADEINFGTKRWSAARYRVMEWEQRDGYSRVLGLNAGGRDPRMIGTRFRLLIREDFGEAGERVGYTIAYYPPESSRAQTDWPSGFEVTAGNPVRVVSFKEDR